MRIIGTIHDPAEAQRFSSFLKQQGIAHQVDVETITDWADPHYGDKRCHIWIVDEDQIGKASDWLRRFEDHPSDPMFPQMTSRPVVPPIPPLKKKGALISAIPWSQQPMGWATRGILFACIVIFLLGQALMLSIPSHAPDLAHSAILRSPVDRELLYDFPHAFEILDKVIRLYGVDKLENANELPYEGQYLLNQFQHTPYWKGVYNLIITNAHKPYNEWTVEAPMFEKVGEGEVWRLVTPIFLHADIFHILFNMLWLIVLGKQIEQRTGPWKYLIFIVIAAIFSDTMQYLNGRSDVLRDIRRFMWDADIHLDETA